MKERVFILGKRNATRLGCMSIIVYGMLFMGVLALVFLVKMTLEGDLSLVENPETLLVLPLLGGAFYQLFSAKNKKQSLGEFHFKEEAPVNGQGFIMGLN